MQNNNVGFLIKQSKVDHKGGKLMAHNNIGGLILFINAKNTFVISNCVHMCVAT